MAIPVQAAPTFRCKLPSTGKEVRYRPYTVREEKILLIALEGQEEKEIADAIKQVVKNCLVDSDVDVDNLPIYDFEYLMLKIRCKSAEEKIQIKFKGRETECPHCKKDKIIEVDLNEVEVESTPGHKNKIVLRDDLGLIMRHPTVKDSAKYSLGGKASEKLDVMIDLTVDCIETIFDDQKLYPARDFTREELKDFVDGLTQKQMKEIEIFFDTAPVLRKVLDLGCVECGHKETYTLQRLHDFFE